MSTGRKSDKARHAGAEDEAVVELRGNRLPLCQPRRPEARKGAARTSASIRPASSAATRAPPPAALRTACCRSGAKKVYRHRCRLWSACLEHPAATRASCAWSGRTSAMSRRSSLGEPLDAVRCGCVLHFPADRPARGPCTAEADGARSSASSSRSSRLARRRSARRASSATRPSMQEVLQNFLALCCRSCELTVRNLTFLARCAAPRAT